MSRASEEPTPDDWLEVFAPATVSNVGPGFDCFGFALESPGDVVRLRLSDEPGVVISAIEGDGGLLPTDAERNTAAVAAAAIWAGSPPQATGVGLELRLTKGLPPCSGLGSSASSAVAGAVAAMHLLAQETGEPFNEMRVLDAALAGEAVASGDAHADNVAPSLMGGFTIVQGGRPPRIGRFIPRLHCWIATVTPHIEISTRQARASLPTHVPLHDAVANWSNASALVLALLQGDEESLRHVLVDRVIEPHRARLIPGYDEVRHAALDSGAIGCCISGSGPTLFALTASESGARDAAGAMKGAFAARSLDSIVSVSRISPNGAHVR